MAGLLDGVPRRYATNSISDFNPELVLGLRGLKAKTWFVNSAAASGGNGASWDSAVTTLNAATALAVSGDVVLVAPGHTEACIAAGTIAMNKAGVTYIGLGYDRIRPIITYTTAVAASFDVSAANVRIINFVFRPVGIDAVTAAVNVTAADASCIDCDFELGNATNQATLGMLTTSAADRLSLINCRFYGSNDAGTAAAVRIVGGDGHRIIGCVCIGNFTTSLGFIDNATTACTNVLVNDCVVFNRTASSTKAMTFQATSTGVISKCALQILSGTAPIAGAAMSWVGPNYYAATIATGSTIV